MLLSTYTVPSDRRRRPPSRRRHQTVHRTCRSPLSRPVDLQDKLGAQCASLAALREPCLVVAQRGAGTTWNNGSLTPTGSRINAPEGFSPTQALISTKGNVVISTEEGGPFRAFGVLGVAVDRDQVRVIQRGQHLRLTAPLRTRLRARRIQHHDRHDPVQGVIGGSKRNARG